MAFKPLFDVENIYDLKDCSDEDHFWLMIVMTLHLILNSYDIITTEERGRDRWKGCERDERERETSGVGLACMRSHSISNSLDTRS